MEELIEELKVKAGLSAEQAQKSLSIVMDYVKTKLPEGLSDKVEDLISGKFNIASLFGMGGDSSDNGEEGGSAFDMLSKMFGGK